MKEIIIGSPCSPSEFIDRKIIECFKVLVSWGGGIGGANRSEFLTEDVPLGNDTIVERKTIFGETVRINTRFVVCSRQTKVVRDEWNTLPHANYAVKKFSKHITRRWIEVPVDANVHFTDGYVCDPPKPIHTDCESIKL